MKRIVAKEFLLFVACGLIVMLVALFGWLRNTWLEHRIVSKGRENVEQSAVLDSLRQNSVPMRLEFLDLFEPEFVRKNCDVFLVSPFWTMDPFLTGNYSGDPTYRKGDTIVDNDPFAEFGGHQLSAPPSNLDKRFLMCVAKALDKQQYFTSDRSKRLAAICGSSTDDFIRIERELRVRNETAWKPPKDVVELYISSMTDRSSASWIEALAERGVPRVEMTDCLSKARADTSIETQLNLAVKGLLCETIPHAELRKGFEYLKERRVLNCKVNDLVYTLQNRAVPPSQVAIDAFERQRVTVDELRNEQNQARVGLWSEAEQWAVVKWAAIVLLVLVYPLRLIVLGTRWALRTLRT